MKPLFFLALKRGLLAAVYGITIRKRETTKER
jgi:hypothetical protein